MAEETTNKDTQLNSFGDLNAVIKDQQTTIDTLADQVKSTRTDFSEPLFNTTPTAPVKPTNFVVIILIGAIIFLILRRK